jgi:hypothetical protein
MDQVSGKLYMADVTPIFVRNTTTLNPSQLICARPGLSNFLLSLVSTITNILASQDGYLSKTAKVVIILNLTLLRVTLCLYILYD